MKKKWLGCDEMLRRLKTETRYANTYLAYFLFLCEGNARDKG